PIWLYPSQIVRSKVSCDHNSFVTRPKFHQIRILIIKLSDYIIKPPRDLLEVSVSERRESLRDRDLRNFRTSSKSPEPVSNMNISNAPNARSRDTSPPDLSLSHSGIAIVRC